MMMLNCVVGYLNTSVTQVIIGISTASEARLEKFDAYKFSIVSYVYQMLNIIITLFNKNLFQ